ncbi:protein CASC3-like isoform X2 [Ornithodoros turicata]|uniref:protein CASC3-like isoform X2 n=1 Tax=Ornithodoros turicata TaxID=34597 RepID=UPI0031399370
MADSEAKCGSETSKCPENVQTPSDHSECSFADAVESKEPDQVAEEDSVEPDTSPPDALEDKMTKASVEETLLERFLNSTPPPLSCEDVEGGCEGTADMPDGAGDTFLDFDKRDDPREDEYDDSEDDDEEDCVEEERQQGDGQESVEPTDAADRILDFDEDKRNPQYIPKKGAFYEHDDRAVGGEDAPPGADQASNEDDKDGRRKKKLWHDEGVWGHDMFREEEQAPKSREELINTYGYDIRSEGMAPRARRRRRYSRGPNKYTRSWQDEDAYAPKGSSSFHGGRRGRGRNPPSFEEEDFPKLPGSSPAEVQKETVSEPVKTLTFENSHYGGEEQDDKKEVNEHLPAHQRQGRGEWRSFRKSNAMQQRESRPVRQPPRRPPHAADEDDWAPNELPKDSDNLRGHEGGRRGRRHGEISARGSGRGRGWNKQSSRMDEMELLGEGIGKMNVKSEDMHNSVRDTAVVDAGMREEHSQLRGGGGDTSNRPKRYSSLRQRPPAEVTPSSFAPRPAQFYDASYQQPQQQQYSEATPAPVSSTGPRQTPVGNQPQPTLLPPGHFPAYAAYPEGFILPPGQPPVIGATPPPVMAPTQPPVLTPAPAPVMAPNQTPVIPGSFLPPTGIVGFTAQYATYSFPPQYNATTPPAPPPQTTQPQVCHGGITYYNTQSQQHKQRSTPPRRPKAAIPIVPPPASAAQQCLQFSYWKGF